MNKILLLMLLPTFVFGCATATKTYTADGKEGFSIDCSGAMLNWGKCYEKAGDLCGTKGYEVLEKDGDTGNTFSENQFGLHGGSIINRSMVVKCNE